MHITCCASAYQVICKRTTAAVRPEILTNSKTYTILSNNLYYVFHNISVTFQQKKGESLTYELDPLRTNSLFLQSLQGLQQTLQRIGINRV